MMYSLYKAGVWLYFVLIRMAVPFNPKAALFYAGRKNLFKHLEENLPTSDAPLVWFHAASLGEFEQGRPVIEELKKKMPSVRILLTFFSPSGFEVRKGYPMVDYICYLPVESADAVTRFYDTVSPSLAVFIKYEFWKEYIDEAKRRNIPFLSISSIFMKSQIFFKRYGEFMKKSLYSFDHFFVQNETSRLLLESINIRNVTIAGDTRFDRVTAIKSQAKSIEIADLFKENELVFVLGSVWPSDMKVLYPVINAYGDKAKFIIAPHQIEEDFLRKMEEKLRHPSIRFSRAGLEPLLDHRVLLIDNIGMLSSLYGYGEAAFVGGGFRGGLHNTLEPAAFGIPVLWGNHEKNSRFQEVEGLLRAGGGTALTSHQEALAAFGSLINEPAKRAMQGKAAGAFVESHTGATQIIVNYLTQKLSA